jgi:FAD/FMN-containing dehydrogenase
MLNRRDFLRAAGLAALAPASCVTRPPAATGAWVNDIHSQLNRTWVSSVVTPRSPEELAAAVRASRGKALCIAGGRHAMGGQQFAQDALLLDMREMKRILTLDPINGLVEVEAGIEWPELIAGLNARQQRWSIRQKQTGADRLTIGGGVAANVHGRGLRMKPFAGDVEAFTVVAPDGELIECSRAKNHDLFALVIGGYGLFGPVATVRLRLAPRQKVQRVVEEQRIETVMDAFRRRIDDGFVYGDFQFSIDESSEDFLRKGVFSCYRPVPPDTPMPATQAELKPDDWLKLLALAHADKRQVYQAYVGYYLSTNGQVYWSDEHQLSYYPDDYHLGIDRLLQAKTAATEMISELYVPRERLADFMVAAAAALRERQVPMIYGTVRLIERDDETFLAWAKQPYACVIFNLHTEHSEEGRAKSADAFRALIDLALARGGSYFLTYHRWARRDQVEAAYPQFAQFLKEKKRFDPRERFQSEWYRHYRTMFGA